MGILDFFGSDTVAAVISRDTVTNVDGKETKSSSDIATIECLFWEGATAEAYVSQRFRDVTDAAIGVYPSTDIQKNDTVSADGVKYHVLGVDNVGKAEEIIIAALRVNA